MSKIIDMLATLGALGVTGYFIYRVILPNLKDIQLPSFQFQQPPQPQQPISSTPEPTAPEGGEEPQQPEGKTKQPTKQTPTSTTAAPPAQTPASGSVIWDSNTHGKWNNGQPRVVTGGEGGQGPDGKGFHTAASGNPTLTIDGKGVGHLTSSRFGRIYVYAKNYNSRLDGNFMFESVNTSQDNISIKMRSRHGNNAHPQGGSATFGGIGVAFHQDGEIENEIEIDHDSKNRASLPSVKTAPFQLGKWYKFSISIFDGSGGVNVRVDLNGKTVLNNKWSSPHPTGIDKNSFNADSYFWLRLNSKDEKTTIKAAFSNIRLVSLGGTSQQNLILQYYPYLYSSFYNRRRL